MTKDELQKHHSFLAKTLDDFLTKEEFYLHGKNSKIRKRSLSYLNVYTARLKKYVGEDNELYLFLTGEKETDAERAAAWEEICSVQSFSQEITKALKKMERKISEMG